MAEELQLDKPLPVGNTGPRNTGMWGVWALIVTEASLFGYLLASYVYLALTSHQSWPPDGPPQLLMPGVNTVVLLASSACVMIAERLLRKNRRVLSIALLIVAVILGAVFAGVQIHEWGKKAYTPATHLYGSLYFTITGFHVAHVIVGLVVLSCLALWIGMGRVTSKTSSPMRIGGLYWHFVDAVWLIIFSLLYLEPYLHG